MKARVISSIILIPFVLAAVLAGGLPYLFLVTLAVTVAGFEYARMLKLKGYQLSLPLVWCGALLPIVDAWWGNDRWLTPGLALLLFSAGAWQLFHREKDPTATWTLTVAGGLYLGIGGSYIIRLHNVPDGLWWTLLALAVVWTADSGAYAIGRRWGRHKMAPTISPGKSWEGYAAELVSGLAAGYFFGWLFPLFAATPLTITPLRGLVLGGLLAAVTPLGDFFESMIKREVGVKDSGNLIPGHGGLFDRIDSLLWAGFLAWGFVTLVVR